MIAGQWLNYRIVRNKLTHEYPDNQEDVLEGIKLAIVHFEEINEVLNNVMEYIKRKKLV